MSNARKRRKRPDGVAGPGSRSAAPVVGRPSPSGGDPRAILWASNSPWTGTGYGQQTAQACTRLAAAGHAVAIASNYGLEGTLSQWRGITHFPRGFDVWSNDVVPAHAAAWAHKNPGHKPLLITLFDTWVLTGSQWDDVPQIASWVPIDHSPIPPKVQAWCQRPNVTPLAMSQFGKLQLDRAGIESIYVPHAIEPVFHPTPKLETPDGSMMTGRELMEISEDRFVVTMTAANKGTAPCRKSFPEALLAFGMWAKHHDDVTLFLHTESKGAMSGIDLIELAAACGIPDHKIGFVDQYAYRTGLPPEWLAAIYTASDVLLAPSMGEGFGVPVVEAQACGTPVIVSNFTAQPELVGDGWLVEGQPWWDNAQRSWLLTPQVPSIIEALDAAYARGRGRSAEAVEFAAAYGADRVFAEHWVPALGLLA